jgi:hypothetical protein
VQRSEQSLAKRAQTLASWPAAAQARTAQSSQYPAQVRVGQDNDWTCPSETASTVMPSAVSTN